MGHCGVQSIVPQRRTRPSSLKPPPAKPTSPLSVALPSSPTKIPRGPAIERRKPVTGDKIKRHTSRHVTETHRGIPSLGVYPHSHSRPRTHTLTGRHAQGHIHTCLPQGTAGGQCQPVLFLTCPQSPTSLLVPAYPTCWKRTSLFSLLLAPGTASPHPAPSSPPAHFS